MHVILVGCGRVGADIATALAHDEHDVVVVDKDPSTFKMLGSAFNGMTLAGQGIDIDVLRRAGIDKADAFAAVTSFDNVNLMACQIARRIFNVPKVVARINDPRKRAAYRAFEVETICPTDVGASQLRAMLEGGRLEVVRSLGNGEVVLVRLPVPPSLQGHQIADLEVAGKLQVCALERGGTVDVPGPTTKLAPGDIVTVTARRDMLHRLEALQEEGTRA